MSTEAISGFVCSHVAVGKPGLFIAVSDPLAPDDTGIEITCGAEHVVVGDYKVVRISRFIDADPAIRDVLRDVPPGFVANRSTTAAPWVIERSANAEGVQAAADS